jgi:hypothetical protein
MVKIQNRIVWKSEFIEEDLDSICVIDKKITGKNVVLVTAKASGVVYEFDLSNGKQIGKWNCGNSCKPLNKWSRPNGIANWENIVGIVERDGKKLKIYDYTNKKLLLTWGENILQKPYGISLGLIDGIINVIVTDDGKNKSVYKLRLKYDYGKKTLELLDWKLIISFDFRTKLESVYLDTEKRKILIADENKYLIYIYDFDSNKFIDLIGEKYFNNETEGISKYKDYWVCTLQSKTDNRFYFFDEDFDLVDEIKDNTNISNTDGICVFGDNLIVINRDSQVVCIELSIK